MLDASSDYLSHRLLRILAERLNARGMETRQFKQGDEVIEIAAISRCDGENALRLAGRACGVCPAGA
jgi:hypothetical protein